jgi:hypothetical protein
MLVVRVRRFLRKFRKIDSGNAVCCAGSACDCWDREVKHHYKIMDGPCPFCDRCGSGQGLTNLAQLIESFSNGQKKGRAAALGDGRLELTLLRLKELQQGFATHEGLSGCIRPTDVADFTAAVGRSRGILCLV